MWDEGEAYEDIPTHHGYKGFDADLTTSVASVHHFRALFTLPALGKTSIQYLQVAQIPNISRATSTQKEIIRIANILDLTLDPIYQFRHQLVLKATVDWTYILNETKFAHEVTNAACKTGLDDHGRYWSFVQLTKSPRNVNTAVLKFDITLNEIFTPALYHLLKQVELGGQDTPCYLQNDDVQFRTCTLMDEYCWKNPQTQDLHVQSSPWLDIGPLTFRQICKLGSAPCPVLEPYLRSRARRIMSEITTFMKI